MIAASFFCDVDCCIDLKAHLEGDEGFSELRSVQGLHHPYTLFGAFFWPAALRRVGRGQEAWRGRRELHLMSRDGVAEGRVWGRSLFNSSSSVAVCLGELQAKVALGRRVALTFPSCRVAGS